MGLGSTAKKLQQVADMAEDVYRKLNDLREQVVETKETVNETERRVDALASEAAEQRALLEAIAEEQGVDLDAVTATAHIGEAEAQAETKAETGAGDAPADDAA
jgi:peptidoglycan hydrolase CwlO-like protein